MERRNYLLVADEDGASHAFGPGDSVPDWARRKITNPDVWDEVIEEAVPQEPPRAGRGSGRDEWARFAGAHNVAVGEDDSRDDIIDVLIERGVAEG